MGRREEEGKREESERNGRRREMEDTGERREREYFQLGKEIKLKNVRVGNKFKVSGNFIHPCVYYKCSKHYMTNSSRNPNQC